MNEQEQLTIATLNLGTEVMKEAGDEIMRLRGIIDEAKAFADHDGDVVPKKELLQILNGSGLSRLADAPTLADSAVSGGFTEADRTLDKGSQV